MFLYVSYDVAASGSLVENAASVMTNDKGYHKVKDMMANDISYLGGICEHTI